MAVPNYSNLEYIEKLKCYFPRNGNDLEFRHHITNWHPLELYSVSPSPSSKTNVKCSMPTLKVTLGVAGFPVLIYHPYELSSLSSQINKIHFQVAMGVAGYPILAFHVAECCCHLGLAASVFLTVAITIERYQVQKYINMYVMKYDIRYIIIDI